MLTESISSNKFYQSKNYQKICTKITDQDLLNYIENSDILKILLSYGVEKKIKLTDKHILYLSNELNILIKNLPKFEEQYFIAYEICNHYRELGLFVNIGRGVSGASMLAYLSGITKVDPVLFDLTYHRFAYPGMDQLTFDIDVNDRSIAKEFLRNKYKKNFCYVGTEILWSPKNAFKEIMEKDKYLGSFAHKDISFYIKILTDEFENPGQTMMQSKIKLLNSLKENNIITAAQYFEAILDYNKEIKKTLNDLNTSEGFYKGKKSFEFAVENNIHLSSLFLRYSNAKDEIMNLIGLHKSYGEHAVGLALVYDDSKAKFIGEKDNIKVLDPKYEANSNVIRINVLNLKVLNEINDYISRNKGNSYICENLMGTQSEWLRFSSELKKGNNEYFQGSVANIINHSGLKFKSLLDFAKTTSYCRPGPLMSYKLDQINKSCPVRFVDILTNTNGWILFQEDVIKIAELIGIVEPTLFLKNFTKLKNIEQYKGVLYPDEFEFLSKYSNVAFNKAHAISYGMYSLLDYRTK